MEDNSHAGQGPVVLDIGGDIGALIIDMPAALAGAEIEARPIGGKAKEAFDAATIANVGFVRFGDLEDDHARSDHSDVDHHHSHSHIHPAGPALVHVAVLGRPGSAGSGYTAVFGELQDGEYELYLRPNGPVALTARVRGGEVSSEVWPV